MNSSPNAALSPKSSILSAEYEKKSIKSLKAEIKGLTRAVNAFEKGSPEYRHLKAMLDTAEEDLNCLLEDQYMFRSFTGSGSSSINNVNESSSDIDRSFSSTTSISTPPLSRKSSTNKTKHFNIPRPPLTSHHSQPITKCPEETIDSEVIWEDKYSSLWFESRIEKTSSKKLSSSSPHSPRRYSHPDNVNHHSEVRDYDDMASKLFGSVNDKYQQRIEHLNKQLEHTFKFSKEYFTIKKEIEDIKARRKTRRRSEPIIHYVKVRI